jgi:glycosyltransferase involved in cell wall biosynthesis
MKGTILVLGYFGYITNQIDGQTIKTRNMYELLKDKNEVLGPVAYFDTQQLQFNRLSLFKMVWQIITCKKLVYLPAHNNLKYIFPFIYFLCKLRGIEILYIVVGGWLAEYLKTKKIHVALLSNIRGIFPETEKLKHKLVQQYGFNNITVLPNFRIHSFTPSFKQDPNIFKIVFMARITRMKGIDVVFKLAERVERQKPLSPPIIIDFYGPVGKGEEKYFTMQLKKTKVVSYKGVLEPEKIYSTLDQYDCLVLPTRYKSEGFPGTILDAYISGVPVIVSNYPNASEIVDAGKTGFIFEMGKEEDFFQYVDRLYRNREFLLQMKKNSYEKSKMYSPESTWGVIRDYIC